MSDAERLVHRLAGLGHRGSATAGERAAAAVLQEELTALGLTPTVEPFRGSTTMGGRLLLPVLLAAAGAGLLPTSPAAGAAVGAVALLALVWEQMTGRAWLTRPLALGRSANLVATVPAVGPARRRLVLVAHYDTQRAGLVWNRWGMRYVAPVLARLPGPLKTPLFPVVAAMLAHVGFGAADVLPREPLAWGLLGVYAAAGLLLAEWAVGRPVPGASDNASGVAAALDVARRWRTEPVSEVELVLLLTGCEETGLLGAAAWCDRHRAAVAGLPTFFLNVDSVGFGPPRFLGCETPIAGWPVAYPADMVRRAGETAAEQGLTDAGPHAMPGPTDGMAFLARGVPGVTVVGFRGLG